MSFYVLDTEIMTLYQKAHPAVVRQVQTHSATQLAVSVISVEEELTGWYTRLRQAKKKDERARAYERLANAVRYLSRFQILSFTEAAMDRYDQLRVSHRNVGKNDLRIAAIVLEHNATLISRNLRDFRRMPGLQVEDQGDPPVVAGFVGGVGDVDAAVWPFDQRFLRRFWGCFLLASARSSWRGTRSTQSCRS